MKKLKNGCSRPVCVGKPIIKPPVKPPFVRKKTVQDTNVSRLAPCKTLCVHEKMKNGCSRPVCKGNQEMLPPVNSKKDICSSKFCKPRVSKYRPRPCKGGSVRSWIKMKNGCKKPICKPIKKCCRKFGRKDDMQPTILQATMPSIPSTPCKRGSVRSWRKMKMAAKNRFANQSRNVAVNLVVKGYAQFKVLQTTMPSVPSEALQRWLCAFMEKK